MLKLITTIADFICNPFKNVLLYQDVSLRIQPPKLIDSATDLLVSKVSVNPTIETLTLSVDILYSIGTGSIVLVIFAVASGSLRL